MMRLVIITMLLFAVPIFATVSDGETIRESFVTGPSITTFTFTFACNSSDDVFVYSPVILTGLPITPLVEDTDYTIAPTGGSYLNGGVVTIDPALAATVALRIVRRIKQSQETSSGAITPATIVAAIDKLTREVQDAEDRKGRSLHIPDSDSVAFDMTIPSAVTRAGKNLGFDDNGNVTITDSSGTFTSINAFWDDIVIKSPILDIRAFGAVGNGTADDKGPIQSAITAAGTDGVVYIPEGTFLVNSEISISGSVRVVGNGKGSILKMGFAGDMFNVSGGANIVFENVLFDGDSTGTFMTVASALELLRMDRVTFKNAATDYCIDAGNSRDIDRIEIIGCTIKDCLNGMRFGGECVSAYVAHNLVDTLTGTSNVDGFLLGNSAYAMQDTMQRYIVVNNIFLSITTTGVNSEAHAIRVYGREAIIRNNIINTVTNGGGSTKNAEAIYTKTRFTTIAGNAIVDGGRSTNGVIAIKGTNRGETSSPQGFANIISGNILLESSVNTDIGIFIAADDCMVFNNYLEGLSGSAIRTATLEIDNVNIINNRIVKHKGIRPIRMSHWGSGLRVNDNHITEILLTEVGVDQTLVLAILLEPDNGFLTDVQINNNYIKDDGSAPNTADLRGIRIDSQGATGRIQGLEIKDNKIFLTSSTQDVFGISINVTLGTAPAITNFVCTGNDFSGLTGHDTDGTRPFYIDGTDEAADIEIVKLRDNIFKGPFQDKAASYNIEFEDSGDTFTNTGQSGAITGTLPVAQTGLLYSFSATEDADIIIDPDGTDLIQGTGSAGATLTLYSLGDSVTLECFAANTWTPLYAPVTLITKTNTITLTATQVKALATTAIELVAAQGADTVIEFVSAILILNKGTAYDDAAGHGNLVINFTDKNGSAVSNDIEADAFIDSATDAIANGTAKNSVIIADVATNATNKPLVLWNDGNNYTTGTGTLTVKTTYRIHALGL